MSGRPMFTRESFSVLRMMWRHRLLGPYSSSRMCSGMLSGVAELAPFPLQGFCFENSSPTVRHDRSFKFEKRDAAIELVPRQPGLELSWAGIEDPCPCKARRLTCFIGLNFGNHGAGPSSNNLGPVAEIRASNVEFPRYCPKNRCVLSWTAVWPTHEAAVKDSGSAIKNIPDKEAGARNSC